MSEKIIYKVWDEMQERWVDDFYIEPNGEIWTQACEDTWQITSGVLVEFTGYTDNNFERLYGQDIVKVFYHSKYDSNVLEHAIGYIYFDTKDLAWMIKIPQRGHYAGEWRKLSEFYNLTEYLEKIGNTFENQELLEEKE